MRDGSTPGGTGRVLVSRDGQRFFFDAGAVALDVAYSGGRGRLEVFETWHRPADLAAWLAAAPRPMLVRGRLTVADLEWMKDLREVIREAAWAVAAGDPVPSAARRVLNRAAAEAPLVPRLDPAGALAWRPAATIDAVGSTLARELLDVVGGPAVDRLRACAADDCPLVFLDLSRPGTRRWCSMARCGNRHKVRTHRAHQPA